MSDYRKTRKLIDEYFDVRRYEGCKNWRATEWGDALRCRKVYENRFEGAGLQGEAEITREWLADLLARPLERREMPFSADADVSSVNDVTLEQLLELEQEILWGDELRSVSEKYHSVMDKKGRILAEAIKQNGGDERSRASLEDLPPEKFPEEALIQPEDLPDNLGESLFDVENRLSWYLPCTSAWASIDLNVPEEVASANFKRWFREKQAILACNGVEKPKSLFTEKDFTRWAKFRVLAYIDLSLFLKYMKVSMPNHVIGDILYPEEFKTDPGERIRNTTRKLARFLMEDALVALNAQACAEMATKGR